MSAKLFWDENVKVHIPAVVVLFWILSNNKVVHPHHKWQKKINKPCSTIKSFSRHPFFLLPGISAGFEGEGFLSGLLNA